MLQGKKEQRVISVNKILIILFFCSATAYGQFMPSKTWGFSYSPGFSSGKTTHGVTYGPGFIDFKIHEPFQFTNHVSAFLRKKGKWLNHSRHVGAGTYYYKDIFTYDPATTATNYLWGRRFLVLLEAGYKLGRDVKVGPLTLVPELGLNANYLVYAYYKSEYTWASTPHQANWNLTNKLSKFNYGYSISIKVRGKLNDSFNFEIGPCYKRLLKEYYFSGDKVLFFYGFSLDLVRRGKI